VGFAGLHDPAVPIHRLREGAAGMTLVLIGLIVLGIIGIAFLYVIMWLDGL
jgi:hypothetical protein